MQSTVFFRVPTRISKALSLPEGISNYYWHNWAKRGTMCASSSGENTATVRGTEQRGKKNRRQKGQKGENREHAGFSSSGEFPSFIRFVYCFQRRPQLPVVGSMSKAAQCDSWVCFCSSKLIIYIIYSTSYDLRWSSTNFTHQSVFTGVVK